MPARGKRGAEVTGIGARGREQAAASAFAGFKSSWQNPWRRRVASTPAHRGVGNTIRVSRRNGRTPNHRQSSYL